MLDAAPVGSQDLKYALNFEAQDVQKVAGTEFCMKNKTVMKS